MKTILEMCTSPRLSLVEFKLTHTNGDATYNYDVSVPKNWTVEDLYNYALNDSDQHYISFVVTNYFPNQDYVSFDIKGRDETQFPGDKLLNEKLSSFKPLRANGGWGMMTFFLNFV